MPVDEPVFSRFCRGRRARKLGAEVDGGSPRATRQDGMVPVPSRQAVALPTPRRLSPTCSGWLAQPRPTRMRRHE